MSKRDYYEVLGLSSSATEKEIKKGYKRLAMKYHPDRTQGDKEKEEQFKEVKEAYEILNDECNLNKTKSKYGETCDTRLGRTSIPVEGKNPGNPRF